MFSVFLSSYRNTRESLGELEKAVEQNTRLWLVFPQHFSFSQTSTRVSIIDRNTVHVFYFLNTAVSRKAVGKSVRANTEWLYE